MCAVHDVKHNIVECAFFHLDFVGMFMLKPVYCKEFVKYLSASVKEIIVSCSCQSLYYILIFDVYSLTGEI